MGGRRRGFGFGVLVVAVGLSAGVAHAQAVIRPQFIVPTGTPPVVVAPPVFRPPASLVPQPAQPVAPEPAGATSNVQAEPPAPGTPLVPPSGPELARSFGAPTPSSVELVTPPVILPAVPPSAAATSVQPPVEETSAQPPAAETSPQPPTEETSAQPPVTETPETPAEVEATPPLE